MKNSRRDFIKLSGVVGAAAILPKSRLLAKDDAANKTASCVLIPSETAGPFPLDLTENSTFFRQDISESKAGVKLNVKMKILGQSNCEPMPNVRVNIWHCDKDGLYSGYDTSNNAEQAGLTYLRGYQFTDSNGEVEFTTVFPGWYTGRICHIHFQVYVSSSYSAVSQMTFDIDTKNALYANNSSIYAKGSDPLSYSQDNIFSDGYEYQLAELTKNSDGSYGTYLEVTVQGSGTVGVGNLEKEAGKRFTMEQNFPNPYVNQTSIPFSLKESAEVKLEIWDLTGRKLRELNLHTLDAGNHTVDLDMQSLGLTSANYVYQMEVETHDGIYRDTKMMTAQR